MKGPRKLDASGEETSVDETGAGVGVTIGPGSTPVEATPCSGETVGLGGVAEDGSTKGASTDDKSSPMGSLVEGLAVGVGETIAGGATALEEEAGTMISGRPMLGPSSGSSATLRDAAAGGVGWTTTSGMLLDGPA